MAGHISTRTWAEVSDEANRKLSKLMQFLNENEAIHQQMVALWTLHSDVDADVAGQLFETATPTTEETAMATDLRVAFEAVNTIFGQTQIDSIRKLA